MSMGRLGWERFGEPKHGGAVMCCRQWNRVWKQLLLELHDCWGPRCLAICLFLSSGTWKDKKKKVSTLVGWFWLQKELWGSGEPPGSVQKCWDWLVMSARAQRGTLPSIDLPSRDEGASLWSLLSEKRVHTFILKGRTLHFTVCKSRVRPYPQVRLCSQWWQH